MQLRLCVNFLYLPAHFLSASLLCYVCIVSEVAPTFASHLLEISCTVKFVVCYEFLFFNLSHTFLRSILVFFNCCLSMNEPLIEFNAEEEVKTRCGNFPVLKNVTNYLCWG